MATIPSEEKNILNDPLVSTTLNLLENEENVTLEHFFETYKDRGIKF